MPAGAGPHIADSELRLAGQPPNVTHSSVYRINGRQSSWDGYDAQLRSYGIFVKARNSLVFQVNIQMYSGYLQAGAAMGASCRRSRSP